MAQFLASTGGRLIPPAPMPHSFMSKAMTGSFISYLKFFPNAVSSNAKYSLVIIMSYTGPLLRVPSACWITDNPPPLFFSIKGQIPWISSITSNTFSLSNSSHEFQVLESQEKGTGLTQSLFLLTCHDIRHLSILMLI